MMFNKTGAESESCANTAPRIINANVYEMILFILLRNQPKQTTMALGINITVMTPGTP
ncbi:unnamed protein product [marine sediment metagenome]|uniref:Uncharacterized protein n=1 Tax=marine sediment metagenome TaxID=412755 RepID=X1DJG1_9ZZZZ